MPGLANGTANPRANGVTLTVAGANGVTVAVAGNGPDQVNHGTNSVDTITYRVAKAIDDEISTTDELLLEGIQHVIADLDNQASVFLSQGKVTEYFAMKNARNNLTKLSLLAEILRGQTRSSVAAMLMDLEARNEGRAYV